MSVVQCTSQLPCGKGGRGVNVTIPEGQLCQRPAALGRCQNKADFGLVAEPFGGLIGYICNSCAERMNRQMETMDK